MGDKRSEREGGGLVLPLGYTTWLLAGALIGMAAEPNGDLWPQSIFTTFSAVALISAWLLQKRRFGIRMALTSITLFAAGLGLVILSSKFFLPTR